MSLISSLYKLSNRPSVPNKIKSFFYISNECNIENLGSSPSLPALPT